MDKVRRIDPDALLGLTFALAVFGLICWGMVALWPWMAIIGAVILLYSRPVLGLAGLALIMAIAALGQ
ncbi:MAG: hypothetical protein ACK4M6_02125 [Hyphomonas sp.]